MKTYFCLGALLAITLVPAATPAQDLPPGFVTKDAVTYKVRVATSFTVPGPDHKLDQVRVWHALPTLKPWHNVKTPHGASQVKWSAGGEQQFEKAQDSHHVFYQKTGELKPGVKFEFVTQFDVRSVHREFMPDKVKVTWEQYADKTVPKAGSREVHREIADVADEIRRIHPPPRAVLEFCKWLGKKLKYDASVAYPPNDVASTLEHCKGHCGHYYAVLEQLCNRVGVPVRVAFGANLYAPAGRGELHAIRPDYTNVHTWSEVFFPGVGWVEVEPAHGERAFAIPAQFIQNNKWFQNYAIWVRENGQQKLLPWKYKDGKYTSDYGVELLITYSATDGKELLPSSASWKMRFDANLDGKLTNASEVSGLRWTVRNNRIFGENISGEIAPGNTPIVSIRQDDARGFIVYYNGRRTEAGHIVGTWFNTLGQSGDFELIPE